MFDALLIYCVNALFDSHGPLLRNGDVIACHSLTLWYVCCILSVRIMTCNYHGEIFLPKRFLVNVGTRDPQLAIGTVVSVPEMTIAVIVEYATYALELVLYCICFRDCRKSASCRRPSLRVRRLLRSCWIAA